MTDNTAATPAPGPVPAESTAIDASLPAAPAPAAGAEAATTEAGAADNYYLGENGSWDRPTEPARPNLAVGLVAGIVLGLLGAAAWTITTLVTEREFLALAILIGFAVAFGFHRFGHTRGVIAGILAAVITFVLYILSVFVITSGFAAEEWDVSFIDALREVVANAKIVLELFFEDGANKVYLAIAVGAAFIYAFDRKSLRFNRANGN